MGGSELREHRKHLGYTQAEFALELGVSATFVGMMERGEKPVQPRTAAIARTLRPKRLERTPETSDPMERIIEEALIDAGIYYVTDYGGMNGHRLDFALPDHNLAIEVKRFHSERVAAQLKRADNVILAQGEPAVRALAALIRGEPMPRSC